MGNRLRSVILKKTGQWESGTSWTDLKDTTCVSETAKVMEWTARPLLRRRRSWRHSTQRSGVHLSLSWAPERNASGHVQRLGCQPPRQSREPTTRQKRTPECALEGVRPKTRVRYGLKPNTSASVP
ncbi:hypothetical protein PGTUg99_008622 [Puccinia graminis f. sp. tritici]|uniref:Uncharacterized protein n=1 Tax=Puccinia graminis f. sp. tritici TaxID=56615 RepID=A0A5B0QZA0_PUCGR|nr:hypothetical protein PGTUg99_008622 [Puccinia graminis f. sp. tritici]